MTSVRKGSKSGPWSIVVYDKRERKVKHQRLVKILQQIPAHYEDVKKKYPRDKIGIEDKYGERVYTESINEMPNFDRGTSGLPRGWIEDYNKIVKKLSKGKGYGTLSKSDKQKVWAALGKKYSESVNEEIIDWQGKYDDNFKFKKGMLVKDINPDCPHHGSEGEVTKVSGDELTYTVRNNGDTYEVGDELTKTKEQLIPLSLGDSVND